MIESIFGSGQNLEAYQMVARAVVIFFVALILIRISGRRSFGQRSPFDYVVGILLGATLSRAIVGASPALPTVAAALAMVLLHRTIAWACVRFPALERLVEGTERELYRNGVFNQAQMTAALVTLTDIAESARKQNGAMDLDGIEAAFLERNGEISLIRRSKATR